MFLCALEWCWSVANCRLNFICCGVLLISINLFSGPPTTSTRFLISKKFSNSFYLSPFRHESPLRKCFWESFCCFVVCRSRPMTNILGRLQAYGEFQINIFGSDCILHKVRPIHCYNVLFCKNSPEMSRFSRLSPLKTRSSSRTFLWDFFSSPTTFSKRQINVKLHQNLYLRSTSATV